MKDRMRQNLLLAIFVLSYLIIPGGVRPGRSGPDRLVTCWLTTLTVRLPGPELAGAGS
jgi:hypothetical protein